MPAGQSVKNKDAFQVLEQVFLHVSVSVAGSTVHMTVQNTWGSRRVYRIYLLVLSYSEFVCLLRILCVWISSW